MVCYESFKCNLILESWAKYECDFTDMNTLWEYIREIYKSLPFTNYQWNINMEYVD